MIIQYLFNDNLSTYMPSILAIVKVIALWIIFEKANEPGWKALIPVYDLYILFTISVGKKIGTKYFYTILITDVITCVLICASAASLILYNENFPEYFIMSVLFLLFTLFLLAVNRIIIIIFKIKAYTGLSKSFNFPSAYAIGLALLPSIFFIIIGFSQNEYVNPDKITKPENNMYDGVNNPFKDENTDDYNGIDNPFAK